MAPQPETRTFTKSQFITMLQQRHEAGTIEGIALTLSTIRLAVSKLTADENQHTGNFMLDICDILEKSLLTPLRTHAQKQDPPQ